MNIARFIALSAIAMGFTSMSGPAAWSAPVWSSAAGGCVPYAQSVNAKRYVNSGYYIAHRGANVDAINLICPITDALIAGPIWRIEFTYMDSTGFGPGASAVAKIMSQSRTTGVAAQVVKFSSDSLAVAAITKGDKPFTHTFDFDANVYFVHIILDRANPNQDVRAYSVAIKPDVL